MTTLSEYERSTINAPLLGSIVWYGVSDLKVRHDDLVALLSREGLASYAPRRPGAADVFRRVCSAAQQKRMATLDDEQYVNILIRDVSADDGDRIIKRIVSELVDGRGKRLAYAQCFDLIFFRASSTVQVVPLVDVAQFPQAHEVARTIIPEFNATVGTVNAAAVRELLRRTLDRSHAVCVRATGGVFFAPVENTPVVEALGRVAKRIPGVDFHALPLIDNAEQRAMVKKAHDEDATAGIDALIGEVKELTKAGKKVDGRVLATLHNQFRLIKEKANAYSGLLDDQLVGTTVRMEILSRAMGSLIDKASDVDDTPATVPAGAAA